MFDPREVQKVLEDLRGRYPESTEADAIAILQDGLWAEQDERAFFARDEAGWERELDDMALSA